MWLRGRRHVRHSEDVDLNVMFEVVLGYLEQLAMPAGEQMQWLVAENYPVSELADQLGDVVPVWLNYLKRDGLLPPHVGQLIISLEEQFGRQATWFWTDGALRFSPSWELVRVRAREAVEEFRELRSAVAARQAWREEHGLCAHRSTPSRGSVTH